MQTGIGIGLGLPFAQGGGAAAVAYLPLAVTSHPDFVVKYAAGALADNSHGIMAFHIRTWGGSNANPTQAGARGSNNKYIMGSIDNTHADAEHTPGANMVIDNSAAPNGGGVLRVNLADSTAAASHDFKAAYSWAVGQVKNGKIFHFAAAWATDFATGSKRGAIAINGVQVTTFTETGTWPQANKVNLAADDFMFNGFESTGTTAASGDWEWADVLFDTPADMSSILDGSGFLAAFLAKLYDAVNGFPVDYGSDASTLLGAPPLIFHRVRPGGVASDFETNRGTAGAPTFIVPGAGTNAAIKHPFLASVHPGETSPGPYFMAMPRLNNSSFLDSDGSYSGLANNGDELAVGDILVVIGHMGYTTGGSTARSPTVANGTGAFTVTRAQWSAGEAFVARRTITAPEVVVNGADWGAAAKPVISWTTPGVNAGFSSGHFGWFVIRGSSGVQDIQSTKATATTVNGGFTCPSATPTSAPGLLVNILFVSSWSFEGNLTPPAGPQLRWKKPGVVADGSYGGSWPYIWDQRLATTSATGTRAYATSVNGNPNACFSIVF